MQIARVTLLTPLMPTYSEFIPIMLTPTKCSARHPSTATAEVREEPSAADPLRDLPTSVHILTMERRAGSGQQRSSGQRSSTDRFRSARTAVLRDVFRDVFRGHRHGHRS